MINWLFILLTVIFASSLKAQSDIGLDREYKLDVPNKVAARLWNFISSGEMIEKLESLNNLNTDVSTEQFLDIYFDDVEGNLYKQDVGLRYRKRFVDNVLFETFIQLKTPQKQNEIKFDIKKSKDSYDILGRHPLLRYVKKESREELDYLLGRHGTSGKSMGQSLSVTQTRKRLYLKDSISSLATLTLDFVTNNNFPFQQFTKLEMKLNEIRFITATSHEQKSMEIFYKALKKELIEKFPELQQDHAPKYSKLKTIIDNSWLSWLYENWMWIAWISIGFIAVRKMLSRD